MKLFYYLNPFSDKKEDESELTDSEWESDNEDEVAYKMVFVVNCQLGMGAGKIASQVSF